jgi:hypothetical protein
VLPTFQKVNHPRTIALLKQIASWAPDWVMYAVADVIGAPAGVGDEHLHILEIDPDDLQEVVWNLVRLPELGGRGHFDIDQALRRLGQSDPIALLEFVRARLDQAPQATAANPDYDALPFAFREAFQGLQQHPRYPDLLTEVMSWLCVPQLWRDRNCPLARFHCGRWLER